MSASYFVPLEGATDNGKDIMVNYDKDTVKDAPRDQRGPPGWNQNEK